MPVNSSQLYPMPKVPGFNDGNNLNIPNVSFMQFFSPIAGVVLGKLATLTLTGR